MEISDFQHLMSQLYFENDQKRGIHRTSLWLVEEMGELVRELKKPSQNFDLNAISEEMADIYAWVASIANILGINLEHALQKKYPGNCIKCSSNPCQCRKNL
jgi:NTP pyrophosphatase (non-canonical NTP hydrolase)